ncbi:MAG: Stp1/IreP family PP2C-type Ser/Thr phosphatase [Clostridia bacterium]|nr:Stp1/IreP family PP2C-type Ser/Thr phosphatase [Clostridia bacterium]
MKAFAATDVGKVREVNQDCVFSSTVPVGCLPNLFIVADGMGGHKAGDIASRLTVDSVVDKLSKVNSKDYISVITDTIIKVNKEVIDKAAESQDYAGMGTTLVVATVFDNILKVANVGDSRLYVIGEDIIQITRDHSLVEEMVTNGQLDRADARVDKRKNIITRAIGGESKVEAEMFSVELKPEDKILMCSDGLSNMVDDTEILEIINREPDIEKAARMLIDAANENGGKDNISVVIVEQ